MCYTVLTDFPPTTKDIVNIVTDDITCYLEFVTPDATLKSKYHFILQLKFNLAFSTIFSYLNN